MTDYPGLIGREQALEALEQLQVERAAGADWENDTLDRFLDGFAALLGSVEDAYLNTDRPVPDDPWAIMAHALRGARFYE